MEEINKDDFTFNDNTILKIKSFLFFKKQEKPGYLISMEAFNRSPCYLSHKLCTKKFNWRDLKILANYFEMKPEEIIQ